MATTSPKTAGPIAPYMAIGLSTVHAAVSMVSINMPVKVIALAAKELFIDVPGEETESLGQLAKLYNTYTLHRFYWR